MMDIAQFADGGVDLAALRDALAGPGMDTRQWVSFALVEAISADQPTQAVEFTSELGPLVSAVLQPSGYSVRCRVAGQVAGNMEAEYYPFVPGDEVLVVVPEGDERAGCTIIARLNNELDLWPGGIAGQDATQNNLAFRRIRAPYVLEFAESYMLRSPATGAFLSMTQDGQVTISNADHAFLGLTPDFIGIQNGDASLLFQLDNHQQAVVLQASPPLVPPVGAAPIVGTSTLTIAENSTLLSDGSFTFNCAGQLGIEHAASAEGVANMLYHVLIQMWLPIATAFDLLVVGTPGQPVFGAPGAVAALTNPGTMVAAMQAGLAAAGVGSTAPFAAAIAAALAAKVPGDTTGTLPSIGSPGILVG